MAPKSSYNKQPIPITEKVKTLSAICEGQLYAHEVLILCYAHKYTTGTNSYEGFWQYKYGITNMDAQVKSLYKRGFLRIGTLEETMATVTLSVLKNIAKQNGLKVSGKKDEVIQRILSAVDEDSLNILFPNKPYFLTELGQHVIKKENYMKYIHNQPDSDINIWNFSEMVHKFPSLPYTEILQRYYSKQAENHLRQKQYGSYRNCIFHIAELDMEDEHFENALIHFFEVTFYDLSGLCNFSDSSRLNEDASQLFSYEYSFAKIAPGILSRIDHCREKLNISESELKEKMIAVLSGIELPFQIFTLEECVDILLLELHQDRIKLEKIYKIAENRYKTDHLPKKQSMSFVKRYKDI